VGRWLGRAGLSDCIPDVVRAGVDRRRPASTGVDRRRPASTGVDQADLAVAAMQLHADSARVGVLGVFERAWSEG